VQEPAAAAEQPKNTQQKKGKQPKQPKQQNKQQQQAQNTSSAEEIRALRIEKVRLSPAVWPQADQVHRQRPSCLHVAMMLASRNNTVQDEFTTVLSLLRTRILHVHDGKGAAASSNCWDAACNLPGHWQHSKLDSCKALCADSNALSPDVSM
jgi:hypothetical protein